MNCDKKSMKRYEFKDSLYDPWSNTEKSCDIDGENYKKLIMLCAQYCSFISFEYMLWGKDEVSQEKKDMLEPFRIERPRGIAHNAPDWDEKLGVRYYRLCPRLCEILICSAKSIFEWYQIIGEYNNPENPTFYRPDGSVFLESNIHEGELILYVNEDEDVSEVVSLPGWSAVSRRYFLRYDCDAAECIKRAERLFGVCRRYCKYFSLSYPKRPIEGRTSFVESSLAPFAVDHPAIIPPYYDDDTYVNRPKYYLLSDECFAELIKILNSRELEFSELLESNNRSCPENPTFYRPDGSRLFIGAVFMSDVLLYPLENEDVSELGGIEF